MSIVSTSNPLTGMAMQFIINTISLHPVYKDEGDDGYYEQGKKWWLFHTSAETCAETQTWILLTALFFLCVRSQRALDYMSANPEFLLSSMEQLTKLYNAVCLSFNEFFGMKEQNRNKHSSEQKLWTAGMALDRLPRSRHGSKFSKPYFACP